MPRACPWVSTHAVSTYYEYTCTLCHKDIVSGTPPASYSIADKSKHVSGYIDWNFDSADGKTSGGAYSIASGTAMPSNGTTPRSYGNCNNTYCHSNVQPDGGIGAPTVYATPQWGTAISSCGPCHAGGHGNLIGTGSHTAHLSYSFTATGDIYKCVICHNWFPTTGSLTCVNCHVFSGNKRYAKHANYQIDIAFDTAFNSSATYNSVFTPGNGYSSCNNTYCHSNGTSISTGTIPASTSADWGSGVLACNACHGNPPDYANASPKANSHGMHVVHSVGDCSNCHYATTTDGATIADKTKHVNKTYDLQAKPGYSFTYSYAADGGTCMTNACHGDAKWGSLDAPAGSGCATCHGHDAGYEYEFGKFSQGRGTFRSHSTHTENDSDDIRGPNLACDGCHNTSNFPYFKDGATTLAATTVCNDCHSAGGAYDGVTMAKANWRLGVYENDSLTLKAGKELWCITCHDNAPTVISGQTAPNKAGDNSTYGYYATGHGKNTGYARLSWQDSSASGNPGANKPCTNCHDASKSHINIVGSNKRLKTGYENENNANCKQCHDPGTVATGDPQWYTTYAAYQASAHKDKLCSDCHDVHGTTGANAGMTTADKTNLCNQCHSGNVGHALGVAFTQTSTGKSYTLQCASCHNVHIVTGKYTVDPNKSPITKFTNNTALWGAVAGQKMDDYASARGGNYRTPKGDTLSGSQLPDIATFCLDCHSNMSGGHGDLNWNSDPHGGQSANQPNGYGVCPNWPSCGEAFGWNGDDCTSDQAACWPVIPRGDGDVLFSRPAYTHTERIAGANFVLSCSDCHVTHENGIGSKLRATVNNGPGSTIWNTECNACHYYYNDNHDADGVPGGGLKGCANASCHQSNRNSHVAGSNSPHNADKMSGSGGTRVHTQGLVLDYRFENNLKDSGGWQLNGKWYSTSGSYAAGESGQAVVLGEDIGVQVGTENSYWSTDEGYHGTWKYTEMKYNTSLEAWVYPTDSAKSEYTIFNKHVGVSNNGGYAFTLKKINGTFRALFAMAADNNGFTQDGRAGVRGAYSTVAVPLNKWTHVAVTFNTSGADRNPSDPTVGRIRIYVNGEDVTTSDSSGNNMQPGSGETSIYAYSENSPWNQSICWVGTWCASEFSIGGFDWEATNFIGRIDEAKVWNITKPVSYFDAIDAANAPEIVSAEVTRANQLTVTFSEGVYTNNNSTGALVPADFVYTDTDNGRTITAVTHTAGSRTAVLTLSSDLDTSNDIGVDTVKAVANSIFDNYALAAGTTAVTISGDITPPAINSAVVSSSNKVTVTFSKAVYTNSDSTGALVPADFVYTDTDNGRTITAVTHTAGSTTAVLTLSSNIDASNDIGVDTVAAVANSIFDNIGVAAGTSAVTLSGSLCPSPATFNLNEAAGSTTVQDSQGYLTGTVYGSGVMTGSAYSGDGSSKYIVFTGTDSCLQATTALTIEARIKPTGIPVDTTTYIARIFARNYNNNYNYQISVWRNNSAYPGLYTAPAGQTSIALWLLTNGTTTWKPVLTNYQGAKNGSENDCPIVSDHWYQVKAVWNTNKPGGTPGQFFTPADIYIDDQGTDGSGAGESWAGYINCTDSDQSLKTDTVKFYTNDQITAGSGSFAIGANKDTLTTFRFNGLIDWITWKDTVE